MTTTACQRTLVRAVFPIMLLCSCGGVQSASDGAQSAVDGTSRDRQALLDRGAAAGQRGDLDEAEAAFRRLVEANPNDGLAHFNLGSVFIDRANATMSSGDEERAGQQASQALVHFERALGATSPGPRLALLLSARILVQLGRPLPAVERLTDFLRTAEVGSARRREAEELLVRARHIARYVEGMALLSPNIDLVDRETTDDGTRAESLRRGIVLLQAFVADEPESWPAHWFIGKGWQALGDHEAALQAFETAYELNPNHADVGRELTIEALGAGRFEQAVAVARVARAARPDDPGLRANLALSLLMSGDVEAALREVEEAHLADPADAITRALRTAILDVRDGRRPRPATVRELLMPAP